MAGYELIDAYLESLGSHMVWHRDRHEVDVELRDHLYSAVEAAERSRAGSGDAQRQVLDRFGDPAVVALAFASTGSRGVALPTESTTRTGSVALVAAGLWVAVAAGMAASYGLDRATGNWEGVPQILFIASTAALLAAAVLTVITVVGLQHRHGGLGVIGRLGVGVAGLGAATSLVSWFVYGWASLLGAGTLLIAVAMLRRGIAPRLPTLLFGGAWLIANTVGVVLLSLQVGPRDEWGDYPLVKAVTIAIGATVVAAGLAGLGRWLTSEQPQPTSTPAVQ